MPFHSAQRTRLRHKAFGIAGLDAAAIDHTDLIRRICSETLFHLGTDLPVGMGSHFRRGRFACADRPDGFLGDDNARELVSGKRRDPLAELLRQHGFHIFLVAFSNAENGDESGIQSRR